MIKEASQVWYHSSAESKAEMKNNGQKMKKVTVFEISYFCFILQIRFSMLSTKQNWTFFSAFKAIFFSCEIQTLS